jgi:hypothetical protein
MSRIWIITAATVVTAWFARSAPVLGQATTIDLGALVLSVSDSPTRAGLPHRRSAVLTERYLGCKQKLRVAVNDRLGIEPDAV